MSFWDWYAASVSLVVRCVLLSWKTHVNFLFTRQSAPFMEFSCQLPVYQAVCAPFMEVSRPVPVYQAVCAPFMEVSCQLPVYQEVCAPFMEVSCPVPVYQAVCAPLMEDSCQLYVYLAVCVQWINYFCFLLFCRLNFSVYSEFDLFFLYFSVWCRIFICPYMCMHVCFFLFHCMMYIVCRQKNKKTLKRY